MRPRLGSRSDDLDNITTMLNILSTTEKKKVLVEYRLRLAVVSVSAVGVLVLASLALLIPPYLLALSKYNAANEQLSALEAKYGDTKKEKEIAAQIRDINTKIALLSSASTNTRLSPPQVISDILTKKNSAIKIIGITYDSATNQERIVLTGTAVDRDSLANFVEVLKKDSTFTSITLPISSYVKSENIDFSLVAERRPKAPGKK